MSAYQDLSLIGLLARAGAPIRGHSRADCPKCKRSRSVSFDECKGVYHCHAAGCEFSGGALKLARELGFVERLSPAKYRDLREHHDRAARVAQALFERIQARRFELLEELRSSSRLEQHAHEAGSDHPATWPALALVYAEQPRIEAELAVPESTPARDLVRFLGSDERTRAEIVAKVIERDAQGSEPLVL
jgi:ribosomal protein L37AE/L43A